MQDTIEELDYDTCAAFTFLWNLCCSWLPPVIIDDINSFVENSGLPPMNRDIQEVHEGGYNITIDDLTISFAHVSLAPPMGLTAHNYARLVLILLG
jgi:hypothetical protein